MSVQAVTKLAVKRTGRATFQLSWKYKPSAFDKDRDGPNGFKHGETQLVEIYAQVTCNNKKKTKSKKEEITWEVDTHTDLRNYTSQTVNLARFYPTPYPQGKNTKWESVTFWVVAAGNVYSWSKKRYAYEYHTASVSYSYATPKMPSISSSFNTANGIMSFTVKTNSGEGKSEERYDTRYRIMRVDSSNRKNAYKKQKAVKNWATTTSTEFTTTYDVSDHASILQNENITISCEAYARGAHGDSSHATRSYKLAYPAEATISKITASAPANGTVTIAIKTNATTARPVTTAKLQRLYNTTIGTAATAAASLDWEDVSGAVDNDRCSGFTDQKVNATPEVRKHTWYRVATTYGALTVYGMPVEAKCLYRAKDAAGTDAIKYRAVTLNDEGDGIKLDLGWASDNYTENEVTWANVEDAWESTDQPNSFTMDWEDATHASGYAHSGSITICGLTAGEPCYIRCRRIFDNGETVMKGPWCPAPKQYYPVDVGGTMGNVVLFAPEYVMRGSGIDCQWEFDGVTPTNWAMYRVKSGGNTVLVSGKKPAGRCTVSASKLKGLDSVTLRLGLKSGGVWVYSNDMSVEIFDKPIMGVSVPATLTAQPLSMTLTSSVNTASAKVYVTAAGNMTNIRPDGGEQVSGDMLWADLVKPAWSAVYVQTGDSAIVSGKTYYTRSGSTYTAVGSPTAANLANYYEQDGYSATVTAPSGLAFVDGADYEVSVIGTDDSTGLSADMATAGFAVEWAHQAEIAGDDTELTVDAEKLAVTITPAEPENAEESASYALTEDEEVAEGKTYYTRSGSGTEQSPYVYTEVENPSTASIGAYYERTLSDVCDVYRVTPDGHYLVFEGLAFGTSCIDNYAPFSSTASLAYCLCTRTADGDLCWDDFRYELPYEVIRIDWSTKNVELPWGIASSDSYKKPFEISERWDGSRVGHWGAGTTRNASLTTAVLRSEGEQASLLRELAQYQGACFVRTPDACAYEADVQVDTFGASFNSLVVPASLTATQVTLTDAYMATVPTEEPTEEEGE